MNARKTLLWLAGLAAVASVARLWRGRQAGTEGEFPEAAEESPVPERVEQTLERHHDEETPMVQAFEDALERENQYEADLARDAGLIDPDSAEIGTNPEAG